MNTMFFTFLILAMAATVTRTIGPGQFAADMKSALDHARDHGHHRDAKQLLLCVARLAEKAEDLLIESGNVIVR